MNSIILLKGADSLFVDDKISNQNKFVTLLRAFNMDEGTLKSTLDSSRQNLQPSDELSVKCDLKVPVSVRRSCSMPAIVSPADKTVMRDNERTGFNNMSTSTIYSIWSSLKKHDSSNNLSFEELQTICEAVGLEKKSSKLAAKRVFEALSIQMNGHISFDQFMSIVVKHYELLECEKVPNEEERFTSGVGESAIELPYEIVERETLLKLWSEANICHAEEVLKRVLGVGYDFKCFKFSDIESAIEEEIEKEALHDTTLGLFKAETSMHRHMINSLKQHINQVTKENQRLFEEKKDVCRRNSLLIQDYDENLESITKNKMQALERDHSETLKKMTDKFHFEREHLILNNQSLETRTKALEEREKLLIHEIQNLKKELRDFEVENLEYHRQIEDLLDKNIELNNKLASSNFGNDEDKTQMSNEEMLELLEKVEILQLENAKLRDENDEYISDIEKLNVELVRSKRNSKVVDSEKTYKKLEIVSTNSEIPPTDPYYNNENVNESTESSQKNDDNEMTRKINDDLKSRVEELENSLDLMNQEYEECENYWQVKVHDERIKLEDIREMNERKMTELLQKVSSLEEQQIMSRRNCLSPIDEKSSLESQYMELEREARELQEKYEAKMDEKNEEIQKLIDQLHSIQITSKSENIDNEPLSISSITLPLQEDEVDKSNYESGHSSDVDKFNVMRIKVDVLKNEILKLVEYRKNLMKEIHAIQQKNQAPNSVS